MYTDPAVRPGQVDTHREWASDRAQRCDLSARLQQRLEDRPDIVEYPRLRLGGRVQSVGLHQIPILGHSGE